MLDLPPEIKEQIFSYCSKSDLANIAFTSKECYNDVYILVKNQSRVKWTTKEII